LRDQEKDQELRGLFQDLQDEDRERIPDFKTLMARAREEASGSGPEIDSLSRGTRRIPRRLAWGGSLLAAAAAAVLLLVQIPGTSDSEFERVVRAFSADPASGAWKSPTAALLDVPGAEILSTFPSISTTRLPLDPRPTPQRNEL
jgi:hypothetical protein